MNTSTFRYYKVLHMNILHGTLLLQHRLLMYSRVYGYMIRNRSSFISGSPLSLAQYIIIIEKNRISFKVYLRAWDKDVNNPNHERKEFAQDTLCINNY